MRFLFFAAQYLPTVGGAERYTYNLACALINMGHSATVVSSKLPNLQSYEVSQEGIEIIRVPSFLPMKGRFPFLKYGKELNMQAKRIWAKKYDFAVINTHFYSLSVWAAKQCKKKAVPAIMLEHGTKHLSLDNKLLDVFAGLYEHMAMRLIKRNCKQFGGVSKACGQWLSHFNVAAKTVLYNAVNAESLRKIAAQSGQDFKSKLKIEEDTALLVFTGRLIREKGVWELLAGFGALRKSMPNVALVLAGDGPLMQDIKKRAGENVYLLGSIPYAQSLALLSQCDVFCLPTYSEGFSGVILEAAAVGACIITTPTGGSPELILSEEYGILLQDISAENIEKAFEKALRNPDWRKSAGAAVQKAVETNFTWQKTAQSLVALATKEK